jgi:hypothetical protein
MAHKTGLGLGGLSTLYFLWGKSTPANENEKQNDALPAAKLHSGLVFKCGVSSIPHDDKKFKGGEDAWTTCDKMIAVADGVGGWANRGVDPGLFAKQLCKDI